MGPSFVLVGITVCLRGYEKVAVLVIGIFCLLDRVHAPLFCQELRGGDGVRFCTETAKRVIAAFAVLDTITLTVTNDDPFAPTTGP